jgi:hypothetical protein
VEPTSSRIESQGELSSPWIARGECLAEERLNVQTNLLIHFHKNGRHGHCLKTVVLRGNRVRPGKKIVDAVTAEIVLLTALRVKPV